MRGDERLPARLPSPTLLTACAWLGIVGCALVVGGNLLGSFLVPDYDFLADTVSDLAAGRYEVIQDVAIYAHAAAAVALAVAAAHLQPDGRRWSLGILFLCLMALLETIIAARNEYGDGDAGGIVIHLWLVLPLGLLYIAAPLAMARGMARWRPEARRTCIAVAVFLAVGIPAYWFVPTGWDGLAERALGLANLAWMLSLCRVLLDAGRRLPPIPG